MARPPHRQSPTVRFRLTRASPRAWRRSWLLGFGRFVRVLAPSDLVDWIEEELDQAHEQYAGGDSARAADSDIQPGLPFLFNRLVNA